MAMSIGVSYTDGEWETCLAENGQILELCSFANSGAILDYMRRICSFYPEPIIALSSSIETSLCSLQSLVIPPDMTDVHAFVAAITFLTMKSLHLPALKYLRSVPRYRTRKRKDMGDAHKLCAVATLLYRMRQQEALWSEMRFFYVELGGNDRSIIVVKDGQIVDGLTDRLEEDAEGDAQEGEQGEDVQGNEQEKEQAFWEVLTQDVAGLMAIHRFEDIVFIDHHSPLQDTLDATTVVDRLGDTYQFYHFPYTDSDPKGFEVAIGAALIAEGLYHPGLAAEVVERLQIR